MWGFLLLYRNITNVRIGIITGSLTDSSDQAGPKKQNSTDSNASINDIIHNHNSTLSVF